MLPRPGCSGKSWLDQPSARASSRYSRRSNSDERPDTRAPAPPIDRHYHYANYVEDVSEIKKQKRPRDDEALLLTLIDAVEADAERDRIGLAADGRRPSAWRRGQPVE